MEKMNQVSVSEFFAKSKEEMYDMTVEMVEKYNRLVDICNDSAERMADLIERHVKKVDELKKESEKWQDLAKMNRDTICNQYDVCEDFKNKIAEIEEENEKLKVDLIHEREKNEKLAKDYAVQENDMRKYTTEIKTLEEKVKHQRENLDGINKTLEIKIKENESLIAVRNNQDKEIEAHESENARLTEKIMELKKERDKHMSRVNDLRMELDCMKARKEKHEEAAHDKVVEGLRETITYWRNKYVAAQEEIEKLDGTIEEWKNQERIRTNQLRATESKVEELHESINRLTMHCRAKNTEIARLTKENADIRHEYAKMTAELEFKKKEDDYGKSGFKRYIEHLIEEEERAVPERFKERLNKEITAIFTKEEETKKELKKKYGYAGEIAFRIRSEVDKKRIVDIGEGAEKILGVSRELFDAAIKALVDDGYQEIIGRIPKATNSYVYIDMHVLATPDVETKETANAENIKSLDFDIPCGGDAIE